MHCAVRRTCRQNPVLKEDIPKLKEGIEEMVHPDIIRNPYVLYEQEYEDYITESVSNGNKI